MFMIRIELFRQQNGCRGRELSLIPMATLAFFAILFIAVTAANARDLHEQFAAHDPHSTRTVDHSAWDRILKAHIRPGEDGLNRFNYAGLKKQGLGELRTYIKRLQTVDPRKLVRAEQFAFWVNLYNAKTVEIVTSRYPVDSIRDIRLSNFLVPGPWRKKVVNVAGVDLSLDDIEHKILRPIWRDPRIHYVVNCASVGCPNLASRAFVGARLETLLDDAARAYVNNPRGVRFEGADVVVSSLYDWYADDFGGSVAQTLSHIRKYSSPALRERLASVMRISSYEYDWKLNDSK